MMTQTLKNARSVKERLRTFDVFGAFYEHRSDQLTTSPSGGVV